MELPAHAVQAVGRIAQIGLRGLEAVAGFQFPAELEGLNTDLRPGHIIAVHEHIGPKAAAVAQGQGIDLAFILRDGGFPQCHKGAGLVAAGASNGFDSLMARNQRAGNHLPLPRPRAAQGCQLGMGIFKIHTGAQGSFQHNGLFPVVHHPHVSCDHVDIGVHAVAQFHRNAAVLVPKAQHQCFGFFPAGGRQSFQGRLALQDFMGIVAKIQRAAAIGLPDFQHPLTHIAASEDRAFLRQGVQRQLVQGETFFPLIAAALHHVRMDRAHLFAPVLMNRILARHQSNDIADAVVLQMKNLIFRRIQNRHRRPSIHGIFNLSRQSISPRPFPCQETTPAVQRSSLDKRDTLY